MKKTLTAEEVPNSTNWGNVVPEEYIYYKKKVTRELPLNLSNSFLKWYNLYTPDTKINLEYVLETRKSIKSELKAGRLKLESELSFIILHRAGDYLFLLITTWRNTNEMWESIYFGKATQNESYSQLKLENDHRGTCCV